MATPATHISEDQLRAWAREVVARTEPASLTDRTIAVLSGARTPLTAEHVRRVCEFVYHNAFDKQWYEMAGRPTRYVTFDPPQAQQVIAALRAPSISSPGAPMSATSPVRRALAQATKQADAPPPGYIPPRDALYLASDELKEHLTNVRGSALAARTELFKVAEDTCRQGYTVADVLSVCATVDAPPADVDPLLCALSQHLHDKGWVTGKVASIPQTPNPQHPLLTAFTKAVGMVEQVKIAQGAYQSVRSRWATEVA